MSSQLAVLVETMRREGFELTVGKPQVVTREVDGKLHEPVERVAIDVPEDYLGAVTPAARRMRKGRMEHARATTAPAGPASSTSCRARGLIGFRTEFLTGRPTVRASCTTCSRAMSPWEPPHLPHRDAWSPTAAATPPTSR